MRYPSPFSIPPQRVRTAEETEAMERRVPIRDPYPKAKEQAFLMARYLPLEISPTEIGQIRSELSVAVSPEATETETRGAIESINVILKEIENA